MKKQNHHIVEANIKDTEDLRPGDVCFFYPRFIYDHKSGNGKLFIKGATMCKLLRFSEDDHFAWIANSSGGEAVEVRRIQLVKAPERRGVA